MAIQATWSENAALISAPGNGAGTHSDRLEHRADPKSRYPSVGKRARSAWSDNILQVWHHIEAGVELDVIVGFQNYFVGLHAWRGVAQWQAKLGLQLLDLRQKRTYPRVWTSKPI